MNIILRNNYTNRYSSISYYGIITIILIHLLGYFSIREWLIFSGIGPEAIRIEDQYGYLGLVVLNASALVTFVVIAVIYNYRTSNQIFRFITYGIISIFILRGLSGYMFIAIGRIGTATPFWEFVFSTLAFAIGISGILEVRGDQNVVDN